MEKAGLFATLGFAAMATASASLAAEDISVEKAQQFRELAEECINNWDDRSCHNELADFSRDFAADVTDGLLVAGHLKQFAWVTDQCAVASTPDWDEANTNDVANALIDCANAIYDAHSETRIPVDKDNYSFLVSSTFALQGKKDTQTIIEGILGGFLEDDSLRNERKANPGGPTPTI